MRAMESGTVILEMKDGGAIGPEDVLELLRWGWFCWGALEKIWSGEVAKVLLARRFRN